MTSSPAMTDCFLATKLLSNQRTVGRLSPSHPSLHPILFVQSIRSCNFSHPFASFVYDLILREIIVVATMASACLLIRKWILLRLRRECLCRRPIGKSFTQSRAVLFSMLCSALLSPSYSFRLLTTWESILFDLHPPHNATALYAPCLYLTRLDVL